MAASVTKLCKDKDLRMRLSKNAQKLSKEFDWNKSGEESWKVITEYEK